VSCPSEFVIPSGARDLASQFSTLAGKVPRSRPLQPQSLLAPRFASLKTSSHKLAVLAIMTSMPAKWPQLVGSDPPALVSSTGRLVSDPVISFLRRT